MEAIQTGKAVQAYEADRRSQANEPPCNCEQARGHRHHGHSNEHPAREVDHSRSGSSHGLFTEEYRSVTFEEGMANLIAAHAMWSPVNSPHPKVCAGMTNAPCTTNTFHGECFDHAFDATNPCTASSPDKTRQEATVAAFLWDLIDIQVDSTPGFGDVDAVQQNFFDVTAALDEYPQGYDNREESEFACCAFWICGSCGGIYGNGSDRDNGRNVGDFLHHWSPLPVGAVHPMNCSP